MNGNDMAFPVLAEHAPNNCEQYGLTKREYFAAMSIQTLISSGAKEVITFEDIACEAVQLADALIAELSK